MLVRGADGATRTIALEADVIMPHPGHERDPGDANPLVRRDSEISARELVNIMMAAHFSPSEDSGDDSYSTQEDQADNSAMDAALRLLHSAEEAITYRIEEALRFASLGRLADDTIIRIRVRRGAIDEISIEPPGTPGATAEP